MSSRAVESKLTVLLPESRSGVCGWVKKKWLCQEVDVADNFPYFLFGSYLCNATTPPKTMKVYAMPT